MTGEWGSRVKLLALLCLLPASATGAALDAERLARLKAATVFIEVEHGSAQRSGSGFLVQREAGSGLIVTNAHVVAPDDDAASMISVVFGSGTPDEMRLDAALVARSLSRDLAVLRVLSEGLPAPLSLHAPAEFIETQDVFVLGFPFGHAMSIGGGSPAISITRGSVASNRRDPNNDIAVVQIDADINPGNSGGPVVTPEGQLVGVATAIVDTTDIGFAIPARLVTEMLSGTVTDFQLPREMPFSIEAIPFDPNNHLVQLVLHLCREKQAQTRRGGDGGWAPICEQGDRHTFTPRADGRYIIGLTYHFPVSKTGDYLGQFVLTMRDGSVRRLAPVSFAMRRASIEMQGPDVLPARKVRREPAPPPAGRSKPPAPVKPQPTPTPTLPRYANEVVAPASFSDLIAADTGRYLVAKFDQSPGLGVLDTRRLTWTRQPVAGGDFLIAANRHYAFAVSPGHNQLTRWRLDNPAAKPTSVALPVEGPVMALAVGGNSADAAIIMATDRALLAVDPETLRIATLDWISGPGVQPCQRALQSEKGQLRAAAEGRVFSFWRESHSPAGLYVISQNAGGMACAYAHETAGYLALSPDGALLYTNLKGLYNSQLKSVGARSLQRRHLIPGLEGRQFLEVLQNHDTVSVQLFDAASRSPRMRIDGLSEMRNQLHPMHYHRGSLSEDKRYLLVPGREQLITVPYSNDRIVIHDLSMHSGPAG